MQPKYDMGIFSGFSKIAVAQAFGGRARIASSIFPSTPSISVSSNSALK